MLHCNLLTAEERFVKRQHSITDDKEAFEKRLKQYNDKIEPIFDHYREVIINVSANIVYGSIVSWMPFDNGHELELITI